MSRVFVATETRYSRRVVVKVLAPELTTGLSAERFEREIGFAASLQQANIVEVWKSADPDLQPKVEAVRAKLRAFAQTERR